MTNERHAKFSFERYWQSLKRYRVGVLSFAVAVVAGIGAAVYGQKLIHGNDQAINVIVTVFSILAGFLVAIIAILGDRTLLPGDGFRLAELGRRRLVRRLVRYKWLFFAYLITLGLVFVSLLIKNIYPSINVLLERLYLFLAAFAFVLSMRLPGSLMKIQMERIDIIIDNLHREQKADDGANPT